MRHGAALLGLSSLAIALMSALFGPFILVPGLAATNTMYFAMTADRRGRLWVIVVGVLAVTLPITVELTGLVPPAYTFTGGLMHVMPRATELPAFRTTICLVLTSIAMVVSPGLIIGSMRDALAAAERRLFLQAWNLRQLVPSEARGTLGKSPSMLRVERPADPQQKRA
jgi:serine/threonine-protein kinase